MLKKISLLIFYSLLITTLSAKPVKIIGNVPGKTISINKVDHASFNELLNNYVDDNGDVDYTSWKSNDTKNLEIYLEALSVADPDKKSSKKAKLAFWINAYNALTIYGILEKYPTSTIRNHTSKLFGYNIWKDLKLQVNESAYSLDDIEHEILRKMEEPRIHFAIVCASHSCPRLLNEAYEPDTLEDQLNTNAVFFFANKENFNIDEKKQVVYLSSILDWFGEDFGDSTAAILDKISPLLAESESETSNWKVKYLPYSWKLNDQKTAKSRR